MATNPLDYLGAMGGLEGIANPGGSLMSGVMAGEQMQAQRQQQALQAQMIQQKMAEARQKAEREAQYQQKVQEFIANPSAQGAADLQILFPEQREAVKAAWDTQGEELAQTNLRQLGSVFAALSGDRPDLATKSLQDRITAEKEAGRPTQDYEALLSMIEKDPKQALGFAGFLLSSVVGPEKYASVLEQVRLSQKGAGEDFTLAPGAVRYDAEGNVIASSPYRPEIIRGPDGSVIEYTPGGGGAASGGDTIGKMLEITPFAESGNREFNPDGSRVTSPKGARGIMQVMPKTATDPGYGIKPSNGTPADDARLGRQYLSKMLGIYGNPAQAWAAYNAGPGAVDKAIEKGGERWLQYMPKETQQYVARNMTQLQRGGAAGGSTRIIAPGVEKPKPQRMTPEEVAAEGLDPNTVYYRNTDGVPQAVGGQRQGQLKPWPVQALAARTSNNAALKNLEPAFQILDPKNQTPAAKAARGAIGPGTGMLGNAVTSWRDPEGNDFRSRIGQIGGIIIKDTSGAAVSISEDERLAKWVPLVTDSPQAARAKLGNLIRELRLRNQSMDETYAEDQGYRPFTSTREAKPGSKPGTKPQFRIVARRPAR